MLDTALSNDHHHTPTRWRALLIRKFIICDGKIQRVLQTRCIYKHTLITKFLYTTDKIFFLIRLVYCLLFSLSLIDYYLENFVNLLLLLTFAGFAEYSLLSWFVDFFCLHSFFFSLHGTLRDCVCKMNAPPTFESFLLYDGEKKWVYWVIYLWIVAPMC